MLTKFSSVTIDLDQKQYPPFKALIDALVDLGYYRVNMVLEPGEFAVRGSIIDVFPSTHAQPLRIDYYGDDIDRLNSFNIHSQRSLSTIRKTEIKEVKKGDHAYLQAVTAEAAADQVLTDIHEGDYVVHEDYGIGIYQGLTRLTIGGREGEYLFVRYAGEDKLYVPLDQIHLIHKYSGSDVTPRVNGLHDGSWKKIKSKATNALRELAEDIYLLYKTRQSAKGFAFGEDSVWQVELENAFEHQPTKDQIKVMEEIKRDMESDKPMDRLICGDVGYGKTELLVRAAFKAIENNKQVAILVPTTVLAEQHFHTFSRRLKGFPYTVEVLSRFKDKKDQKAAIANIKAGGVHVVIGTHRLLQKDIEFQDLGLLIVDEEQRFGVTHKEKIKKLKENVDVLTVSATPIPRTLYMALTGARDFSNIATAPVARKPVLTSVHRYSEPIIKEAIENEIRRGGQLYYIYNNVRNMPRKIHQLKALCPEATFTMAHGQMNEHVLQRAMSDFLNGKAQVLVCSTIIENGLDVPNVNTIIIENAENFGLSQIHQIRGRVGRSAKQAYAYLFYSETRELTEKAVKRLQAIREYAALGSGYQLALKDLEIRGAGTMLGERQHGHMTAIGFELYCKLLEESVRQAKKERKVARPSVLLGAEVKAYIPETYIEDARERLAVYRRVMAFDYKYQIDDLLEELQDRYGKCPKIVLMLFDAVKQQLK